MAESTTTLEIVTRIRDLASDALKRVGAEGEQAGRRVSAGAADAERRLQSVGQSASKAIGGEAKRAFGSLALGIGAAASAAGGMESKLIGMGANIAGAFAFAGPGGALLAATSIIGGTLIASITSAQERASAFAAKLSADFGEVVRRVQDARDKADEFALALKAAQSGTPIDTLKFYKDVDDATAAAKQQIENTTASIEKLKASLGKGVSDSRSFGSRVSGLLSSGRNPFDDSSNMRSQMQASLTEQQRKLEGLKVLLDQLGQNRKLFDEANAGKLTEELGKQLRLLQAHGEMARLIVELDEKRKEIAAQTGSDPKALAAFDKLRSQAVQDLNRKQNNAYKDQLEAVTAITERQKIEAQYAKAIRDADGDDAKLRQAAAVHAAQLVQLSQSEKAAAIEKKNAANDYVQSLREQTAILKDQTGEVAKQIENVHRLKDAFDKAGKEGVKAEQDRQKAQKDADNRGQTGTYHDGHMDKGLASRRAKQHKATHERKWRSSAFYNPRWGGPTEVDEEGNPNFGDGSGGEQFGSQTLKNGADPDQIYNNQRTKHPTKTTKPKGPPVITDDGPGSAPGTGGGATTPGDSADIKGAADTVASGLQSAAAAAKEGAAAMKKAAEKATKQKDAVDEQAKATGDVNSALKDNASAQEKATAAMHDLAATATGAIMKNSTDLKKTADDLKKLTDQLKAAGLVK